MCFLEFQKYKAISKFYRENYQIIPAISVKASINRNKFWMKLIVEYYMVM